MGIRRALIVENESKHTLLIRYKNRVIGMIVPNVTKAFKILDTQSGSDDFEMLAESSETPDIWEEEVSGEFEDLKWNID